MIDFEKEIIKELKKHVKEAKLETPKNQDFGDYAFPCFDLSKQFKKNPNEISQQLSLKIKNPNFITKPIGPYLNFFINKNKLAEQTLNIILKEKNNYGKNNSGKNKKIMTEFFHANTHKGVHIGHIRNICLGDSISRILEFNNFKVIRANYQGDIGPHVAKCLWGYLNLKEKQRGTKSQFLSELYSKANQLSLKDENIQNEINEINNKLYANNKKIKPIWKKTRQYCLNDFNKLYKEFNVKFNRLYFESEVEKRGIEIAKLLLKKKIARLSEGAIIVDLNKYNLGIYVALTKDNHAVYHSKDLALAELKSKEYKDLYKSLHIVGKEQELYFKQLFKTFELISSKLAKRSEHIIYGLVMLPEGKMSSREGNVIMYDNLMEKLLNEAIKEVKKRHPEWSNKQIKDIAKKIALAALKFGMLDRDNNTIITFDWNQALNFEGDSGVYILYAIVRINSILKKTKIKINKIKITNLNEEETNLIKKLSQFPKIVESSSNNYKPNLISSYLLELVHVFNNFYTNCPVLKADFKDKEKRIVLINCVRQVLKNGLNLLGINEVEKM